VKVKICGITRPEDACAAAQAGAAALGINFFPGSPRFAGSRNSAKRLIEESRLTGTTKWAGVFVNANEYEVLECVAELDLAIVQLHGEEPLDYLARLKNKLPAGVAVWKAFRIGSAKDLSALASFDCDAWVLDAKVSGLRGGSGKSFDWNILKGFEHRKPLVLSGGLTPANVATAIATVKPDWVDVASGVEVTPAVKSHRLIAEFIHNSTTAHCANFDGESAR
jgi:phosphoribosylanthranilate isomerase